MTDTARQGQETSFVTDPVPTFDLQRWARAAYEHLTRYHDSPDGPEARQHLVEAVRYLGLATQGAADHLGRGL